MQSALWSVVCGRLLSSITGSQQTECECECECERVSESIWFMSLFISRQKFGRFNENRHQPADSSSKKSKWKVAERLWGKLVSALWESSVCEDACRRGKIVIDANRNETEKEPKGNQKCKKSGKMKWRGKCKRVRMNKRPSKQSELRRRPHLLTLLSSTLQFPVYTREWSASADAWAAAAAAETSMQISENFCDNVLYCYWFGRCKFVAHCSWK